MWHSEWALEPSTRQPKAQEGKKDRPSWRAVSNSWVLPCIHCFSEQEGSNQLPHLPPSSKTMLSAYRPNSIAACGTLGVTTDGAEWHPCVGGPLDCPMAGVPWQLTLHQCRQVYNGSHQCLLPCSILILSHTSPPWLWNRLLFINRLAIKMKHGIRKVWLCSPVLVSSQKNLKKKLSQKLYSAVKLIFLSNSEIFELVGGSWGWWWVSLDVMLVKQLHDSKGGRYSEKHWTRNLENLSASR